MTYLFNLVLIVFLLVDVGTCLSDEQIREANKDTDGDTYVDTYVLYRIF